MSATLEIREDAIWMPPAPIFDHALRLIDDELRELSTTLEQTLLTDQIDYDLGYINLGSLDSDSFQRIHEAAEHAFRASLWDGWKSFNELRQYISFMYTFNELRALLRLDPRASGSERTGSGRLTFRDQKIWAPPRWVFDLVTEDLAASIRMRHAGLSILVLGKNGVSNLSTLSSEQFLSLQPTVQWLQARYGDGEGRTSFCPPMFIELASHVNTFSELFDGDPRSHIDQQHEVT